MDAQLLARLRFLVREDAWAAWEALVPDEQTRADTLGMALVEYVEPRLVAAYILDSVATKACADAVEAAEVAGQVVKRFKAGAQYEEEYFAPGDSSLESLAQGWAARATLLREEVAAEARRRRRSGSRCTDMDVTF